jgi:hypothetical protein
MSEVQTVSIAVASAGVFIAAIYYVLQIRHQTKLRKTDLVLRLSSTYESKEYSEALIRVLAYEYEDYNDFVKKYGQVPSVTPDQIAFRMICTFYEQLGMLVARKLVEPDLAYDLFPVEMLWQKVKPIVEGVRKQLNEPRLLSWFEYLYNEMKKRERKLQQSKA